MQSQFQIRRQNPPPLKNNKIDHEMPEDEEVHLSTSQMMMNDKDEFVWTSRATRGTSSSHYQEILDTIDAVLRICETEDHESMVITEEDAQQEQSIWILQRASH